MIKTFVAALVGFGVLDGVWLGLLMKGFYFRQLSAIARSADGGFAPVWPAALLVYVLLALGLATLVLPRAGDVGSALLYGAVFGFVVYGVYDLTSYATLAQYPLTLVVVDIGWGTFACGACAALVRLAIA